MSIAMDGLSHAGCFKAAGMVTQGRMCVEKVQRLKTQNPGNKKNLNFSSYRSDVVGNTVNVNFFVLYSSLQSKPKN